MNARRRRCMIGSRRIFRRTIRLFGVPQRPAWIGSGEFSNRAKHFWRTNMAQGDRAVVISEGKFLRFMKQGHWEYVSRNGVSGVVAMIAVTNDRKLVLV